MRLTGIRLSLLGAFASVSVGLFVWSTDRTYGDTLVVLPTSRTVSVSSPYVLPTSYVAPSSYLIPSYVETAYSVSPTVSLWPTGYVETTTRRGLFGRRWIVERPVVASYPTAYVPTSYVSSYIPTTYVSSYIPTTYVSPYVPTTYVSPYVPTRYLSSYVPTTYVSPTYYSTGYRVRTYRPTTYTYYPTLYETAYRSTAVDPCCPGETIVDTTPIVTAPPSNGTGATVYSRGSNETGASTTDPTIPSYVDSPLPEELPRNRTAAPGVGNAGAATKANSKTADSPPNPPAASAPDADAATKAAAKNAGGAAATPKSDPAKNGGGAPASKKSNPPAAPAEDDQDLAPAPVNDGITRRDSLRPNYSRLRSTARRNILFGTVENDNGDARSEVPVTVINRNNRAIQHSGVSNAFGGFAIRVPDGQWIVTVTMPSGTMQTIRGITVTGGQVMDNLEGREVQNLIISF